MLRVQWRLSVREGGGGDNGGRESVHLSHLCSRLCPSGAPVRHVGRDAHRSLGLGSPEGRHRKVSSQRPNHLPQLPGVYIRLPFPLPPPSSFPPLPSSPLSPPPRHGVRNSLLLAPMPTASTAQILGNNESIEPYTSNIYTRRVLSGEFQVPAVHRCSGSTTMCIVHVYNYAHRAPCDIYRMGSFLC